jgi:hypothetical protein
MQYDTDQARRDFGSYAPEIIEGRKTTEQDAQQTSLLMYLSMIVTDYRLNANHNWKC